MARTLWDPFSTLSQMDQRFDDLVRRTWARPAAAAKPAPGARTSGFVPPIEMRADGADVVITFELPGIDVATDVDIEVAEGRLTVSGQRRDLTEEQGDASQVLIRELRYGSFRRDFALPDGVGAGQVEAGYDRGLLQVRVRDVSKPAPSPQKVAIRAAGERTLRGSAEQTEPAGPEGPDRG